MLRSQEREEILRCIEEQEAASATATVDAPDLMKAVYKYVRRFVYLSEQQAVVVALWVFHTYAIESADTTPYLAITSAEKQCGKTRLLEVLSTIVANPWLTGRVTAAVLVRKVDFEKPTLLLDESDAAFGGAKEYSGALRGLLNTGYRRSGKSSLCVGKSAEMTYKDFSTFCPKCIAEIGKLPDTVADRSVPIRLKRAAPGELTERFRERNVRKEAAGLRERLRAWSAATTSVLTDARPLLPEELSDRQQDCVEPLLAIAEALGQGWGEIGRAAVKSLCCERAESNSILINLLSDIRTIFESRDGGKITSTELASALAAIETSPWGEWSQGKPITPPKLARLLRPFEIHPHTIRLGQGTSKGYERSDFEDAFRRYLRGSEPRPLQEPLETSHPSHPNENAGSRDLHEPSQTQNVTFPEREIASPSAACDAVTVLVGITGIKADTQPSEGRGFSDTVQP